MRMTSPSVIFGIGFFDQRQGIIRFIFCISMSKSRPDLVETGREMYATAPWIEGRKSVPIEVSVVFSLR